MNKESDTDGCVGTLDSEVEAAGLLDKINQMTGKLMTDWTHSAEDYDPFGNTIFVNQGWKKLWGMQPQDVAEYNILQDENLHTKATWDAIKEGFEGTAGPTPEAYFNPEDIDLPGRPRWTDGYVYPVRTSTDEIARVVILLRDITQLKLVTSEISDLRNQMQKLQLQYDAVESRLTQLSGPEASPRLEGLPALSVLRQNVMHLSLREKQVFALLASDHSVKEVAYDLDIAIKSVYTYRARLLQKLGLRTDVQLAAVYRELKPFMDK